MKNRTNKAGIGDLAVWSFYAALVVAFLPRAVGCEFIQEDNKRLLQEIKTQESALLKFEATILQVETTCQNDQRAFALNAAKSAEAESCVALKENSAMTGTLSQKSTTCASQVHKANVFMQTFIQDEIAPMEEGLASVVELDKGLTSLQQLCGKQLRDTNSLRKKAEAVLQRSVAATSKATLDLGRFEDLAEEMKIASEKTALAHRNCDSNRGAGAENLVVSIKNGIGSGSAAGLPPVSAGKSANGESTVTGRILKDQLASGETVQIGKEKFKESSTEAKLGLAKGDSAVRAGAARAQASRAAFVVDTRSGEGSILGSFKGNLVANVANVTNEQQGSGEQEPLGNRQPALERQLKAGNGSSVVELLLGDGNQETLASNEGSGNLPAKLVKGAAQAEVESSQLESDELTLFARVHAKYRQNEEALATRNPQQENGSVKFLGELSPSYMVAQHP